MANVNKTLESGPETIRGTGADKAAFVERLQTILTHWPSADRLARAMGVSPSAFRKWLKGEAEPSRERLVALARAAGVGIAWLAQGEGPKPAFDPNPNVRRRPGGREAGGALDVGQFVFLPRGPKGGVGGPVTPPLELGAEWIGFRNDWVRSVLGIEPDELILATAAGKSMAPTVPDGNILLIDTTDSVFRDFGIYVLEIDGQRLVKRVQRNHDGSLVLIGDNSGCLPDFVDKTTAGDLLVIGRVVWSGGLV